MKKKVPFLLLILFSSAVFISMNFISADINVQNYSINSEYAPNATLIGYITLNFSNVSSNAYIATSFGQNISIASLLGLQPWFNSSFCSTDDCNSAYSAIGVGGNSMSLGLNVGQSQTIGFLLTSNSGSINSVTPSSFSMNVTSDVQQSNSPQLTIDLLNNQNPIWTAYQPSGNFGQSIGCYSSSDFIGSTVTLDSIGVCEKISLPVSPNAQLDGQVSGSGTSKLTMTIEDVNQTLKGSCSATPSNGNINCIPNITNQVYGGINYPIMNGGDFYICISDPFNTGKYSINIEHNTNLVNSGQCGFYDSVLPPVNYTTDYPIFAQAGSFAPVGNFVLNDTETGNSWYHTSNLEQEMTNYLSSKYGNNCVNGCVIPIIFNSVSNQNINISGAQLYASTASGPQLFNSIYNVSETPALINVKNYHNLTISNANISVPGSFGNYTLVITLVDNGNTYPVLSKTINVEKIPQVTSITPPTTAAALPTNFTANINTFGSNANITSYKWNFGDDSGIVTTSSNTISHTYNQVNEGGYNVQITVTNSLGMNSTSNFTIVVVSPKDAVNQILQQQLSNLANIQNQIQTFPGFAQNALNQTLNLGNISTDLTNDQIANQSAQTDEQFISILQNLLQINLPQSVQQTQSALSVPFLPVANNIDLSALQKLGGGTYDSARQNDYINAILSWDLSNANIGVDYNEFSAVEGTNAQPILDTVTLNVNQNPSRNNAYLFIPQLNGLVLSANFSQSGSYYYVPLGTSQQTVQFATTQPVNITQLPIFVAPSLSQISLPSQTTKSSNKILIFGIIIAAIIILGAGSYILLGKWYQKRYESYLFKDKNDLYNIVSYVHSAKSRGMNDEQIEKNLKKTQWTSEQVAYVMKKYAGRGVGIPGFAKKHMKNK